MLNCLKRNNNVEEIILKRQAFDIRKRKAYVLVAIIVFSGFVLSFIDKIFSLLKKTRMKKFIDYLEKKAAAKSGSIEKHRKWGLFVFVAVPLPGTGGWTGVLVASALRLRLKEAMPPIILGVLTAGILMSIISYAIPAFFA